MSNWFKVQVNEILCNGMTNSELGLYIKYKALCEHFRVDSLTWQKIEINFDSKERKVISKLFGITPEVDPKLVKSSSEVDPKLVRSKSEVYPELVRSSSEVGQKSNNKNNDLATPLYIDKTRQDNTRQEKKNSKESASHTLAKIKFSDVIDWESLFDFWEQNKKGGKYANAESRGRMLNKLKELTSGDFSYAKQAIVYAVDNKYQGFSDGSKLYFKGGVVVPQKSVVGEEKCWF